LAGLQAKQTLLRRRKRFTRRIRERKSGIAGDHGASEGGSLHAAFFKATAATKKHKVLPATTTSGCTTV
jgi:hypothetical protein